MGCTEMGKELRLQTQTLITDRVKMDFAPIWWMPFLMVKFCSWSSITYHSLEMLHWAGLTIWGSKEEEFNFSLKIIKFKIKLPIKLRNLSNKVQDKTKFQHFIFLTLYVHYSNNHKKDSVFQGPVIVAGLIDDFTRFRIENKIMSFHLNTINKSSSSSLSLPLHSLREN